MDLQQFLDSTVSGLGYELVDFERSPHSRLLRLFIDRPEKEGGIDVEDCALISEHVSRLLAVENIDYDRLEVSSPGLDRALVKPKDYERFSGEEISVRLKIAFDGQRNFQGLLQGLHNNEEVMLQTNEGKSIRFKLANIAKARIVPKF